MGYRKKLGKRVLAGTLTVSEAQQMLGRRKAQKKFRKSQGRLTSGTVKAAAIAGVAEGTSPAFLAKSQVPVSAASAPAAMSGADIFSRYLLNSDDPAEREWAWRDIHPQGRP